MSVRRHQAYAGFIDFTRGFFFDGNTVDKDLPFIERAHLNDCFHQLTLSIPRPLRQSQKFRLPQRSN